VKKGGSSSKTGVLGIFVGRSTGHSGSPRKQPDWNKKKVESASAKKIGKKLKVIESLELAEGKKATGGGRGGALGKKALPENAN